MQFLEPRFNRRTDRYGGSFDNRSRFFIELLHALKRSLGDRCAITTRFEIDTLHGAEGVEAQEDGLRMLELLPHRRGGRRRGLEDRRLRGMGRGCGGIALSQVRLDDALHQAGQVGPGIGHSRGRQRPADQSRRHGRLDPLGALDIIGAARPSIADPFLPTKISEGRVEDIRECIGCNICVSKFQQGGQIMCTQNVTIGEEYRRGWHPEKFTKTAKPCSVLVVGGGPAGMECARILGERGYTVHLREARRRTRRSLERRGDACRA